ncbi:hypothetical protein PWT90_08836 [Aphanocladium album]|nr:hypothetical protein PWT90_08836 [Aphanocladium album]
MSLVRRPVSGLVARRARLTSTPPPSCCLHQQRRAFISEALNPVIDTTSSIFTSIHGAGVPWYLTIPLVALGVNLTVRLPMQLYMQTLDRTRSAIKPLVVAWSLRHAAAPFQGSPAARTTFVNRQTERSRKRLYRAWGVPLWKQFIPMSSMLPFVVVSEALRRLSGVSMLGAEPAATADMSLQTGGCLWFTDLMAPDLTLGLPLVCSALLAGNLFSRMSLKQWRDALVHIPEYESNLQRLLRGLVRLSLFIPIFPLCVTYLPASVFLYWAANFAMQLVNVNLVKKLLPEKKSAMQWKPMQPKLISYVRRPRIDPSGANHLYNSSK